MQQTEQDWLNAIIQYPFGITEMQKTAIYQHGRLPIISEYHASEIRFNPQIHLPMDGQGFWSQCERLLYGTSISTYEKQSLLRTMSCTHDLLIPYTPDFQQILNKANINI